MSKEVFASGSMTNRTICIVLYWPLINFPIRDFLFHTYFWIILWNIRLIIVKMKHQYRIKLVSNKSSGLIFSNHKHSIINTQIFYTIQKSINEIFLHNTYFNYKINKITLLIVFNGMIVFYTKLLKKINNFFFSNKMNVVFMKWFNIVCPQRHTSSGVLTGGGG